MKLCTTTIFYQQELQIKKHMNVNKSTTNASIYLDLKEEINLCKMKIIFHDVYADP